MKKEHQISCKQALAENLWLNYFNNYLFDDGTISEREYKRMAENIAIRHVRQSHCSRIR